MDLAHGCHEFFSCVTLYKYRTGVSRADWNNARHSDGNDSARHGSLRSIQVCIIIIIIIIIII